MSRGCEGRGRRGWWDIFWSINLLNEVGVMGQRLGEVWDIYLEHRPTEGVGVGQEETGRGTAQEEGTCTHAYIYIYIYI